MRKTFGLIVFTFSAITLAYAQRGTVVYPNEVKVHLFDVIYGNYAVQYDHFIGRFSAIQTGARFILGNQQLEFDTTESLKKIGGGVQAGWRYYIGSGQYNREPRGAYIETRLKVNFTNYSVADLINGGIMSDSLGNKLTVTKIYAQFNLYAGLEVVILDTYCIDVFAGPGIGNGRLCFPDGNCERETEMFLGFFGSNGETNIGFGFDGGIAVGILF